MKRKLKAKKIVHLTCLLRLSEYQVVEFLFRKDDEEIVCKFISESSCRICCPLFCQLCGINCLFIFNLTALNAKLAADSISSLLVKTVQQSCELTMSLTQLIAFSNCHTLSLLLSTFQVI